tara:strand:- start:319 stop:693 length:375 start_codon:yes stop_codon:yes gene_type:complete
MKKLLTFLILISFSSFSYANMSDDEKNRAWDCSGIYMANYFLPSGETFEYSMKEKSMASVKVFKAYAIETGIAEEEWDKGFNKSVDKHYGSKYDEAKTEDCHKFLEQIIPDGKERVNKVVQTLY